MVERNSPEQLNRKGLVNRDGKTYHGIVTDAAAGMEIPFAPGDKVPYCTTPLARKTAQPIKLTPELTKQIAQTFGEHLKHPEGHPAMQKFLEGGARALRKGKR